MRKQNIHVLVVYANEYFETSADVVVMRRQKKESCQVIYMCCVSYGKDGRKEIIINEIIQMKKKKKTMLVFMRWFGTKMKVFVIHKSVRYKMRCALCSIWLCTMMPTCERVVYPR